MRNLPTRWRSWRQGAGFLGLAVGLALAGCPQTAAPSGDDDDDDTQPTGTPPTSEYPAWVYRKSVDEGSSSLKSEANEHLMRVDGFTWASHFLAPTLVAEQEQEIHFEVINDTELDLDFAFEGVEVVDSPTIASGTRDSLVVRTTPGPGVYFYRATSPDDRLARLGIVGLVTVRDACEFEPRKIQTQANLVLIDTWPEDTALNACTVAGAGEVADTGGACPHWAPPEGPATAMFIQYLAVTSGFDLSEAPPSIADCDDDGQLRGWVPVEPIAPERGELRHGGPPNEFETNTNPRNKLILEDGKVTRLNLGALTDEPHTIHFGGLTFHDPVSGEQRDRVYLEPGQGSYILWTPLHQRGTYLARCIEEHHDHRGLDEVLIEVRAPNNRPDKPQP